MSIGCAVDDAKSLIFTPLISSPPGHPKASERPFLFSCQALGADRRHPLVLDRVSPPLQKSGMIASKEVPDPRSRQPLSLVAAEELDRFLDRHLPLGLMAHELGTQARHVAARLDRAEVWPIPLPERCSKIYLRHEATPIIAI